MEIEPCRVARVNVDTDDEDTRIDQVNDIETLKANDIEVEKMIVC